MTPAAVVPFHPAYARRILDGRKTIEVRTRQLRWDRIYIYETGGDRLIVGRFDITDRYPFDRTDEDHLARACLLHRPDILRYVKPGAWAHDVAGRHRFDIPTRWEHAPPRGPWGLSTDQIADLEGAR